MQPYGALKVIKQFFQYLNMQQEEVKFKLKDYNESYIKTLLLDEKQKDFIQGIM